MGYYIIDTALERATDYLDTFADTLYICSQEPETYEEASSTYMLAEIPLYAYDKTEGAASPSGRKLTISQIATPEADATGTGTYIALCWTGNTELLYVGPCSSVSITASKPVVVRSFTITLPHPVAAS